MLQMVSPTDTENISVAKDERKGEMGLDGATDKIFWGY